ncbi:MAG: isochorismatase family protein [Gammaproteobacteria bacterium]|nr:isochorismatase family protein [Gammaproteobacteria bacterium]
MADKYADVGYASQRIEFGSRPAVLVVDFQLAFTDPQYPLGGLPMVHKATERTGQLLKVAREFKVPVASCYTAYGSEQDMPRWKVQAVHDQFYYGHPCTEIDPRVLDRDHDFVFCKNAPSIFFLTPVTTFLTKHGVDTVIITGCTTSGCVRASVVDAFSHGYRVIVAEDCVGDVDERPHQDNLRDVGRRYCEIVQASEIEQYFRTLRTH